MALQLHITPVTAFRQNCSLLWDDETRDAVLIDVGGDAEHLLAEVGKRSLKLNAIWLTHGHLDHAGGVPMLLEHLSVPVIGPHQDDSFLLDALPETTASYGFPVCPAFQPDRWLQQGDVLTVGRYRFNVLHIPGHTPGHVVFHCPEAKLLLAGDVLFYESIGRTDFPRGNHQDLLDNIAQKLYPLPDDTLVVPGHARTTSIGHEKRHNPYIRAQAA